MGNIVKVKLPTLAELVDNDNIKENQLMVLLNQEPPQKWLLDHPMTKKPYLPIERVEYLLSRIFSKWWVEVKETKVLANSVTVTVRLYVRNPVTGETEWQDGIGAMAIQTDKGKGATDWNFAKADGVMKAAPSAKTYAIKDAAEQFGKLFGKDLSRAQSISYDDLLKQEVNVEDLRELFDMKKGAMSEEDRVSAARIINNEEKTSYNKLYKKLSAL
jgi:hypothetical protein